MSKPVLMAAVVLMACAAGYGVWKVTDSDTASYVVGVVGTAVGIAALLATNAGSSGSRSKAKVRVGRATRSPVTGVKDRSRGAGTAQADVGVKDAQDSEIIGVDKQEP